ncbi:hypothetical protein GFK26_18355 [Variovorax paradoxus]|uniref:Uncharacterized protein n=1 Tax=Variovorax paradoxus TaxID=34073 RepID=A0A5Q0M4N8_VARPD|nr:hypothetical protein [Variovorax paradoxus]QFZ84591.1 hypothetical protein GFK26_18355 [Variovorax paradoxus]
MIEVVFNYDHDEEHGVDGWIPEAQPDFNANINAFGVAHDVLDHHDLRDGSHEGEMRAFGAMLCSRGETGHMANQDMLNRQPGWLMGSALASILSEKWDSGQLDVVIPNAGQRLLGEEAEAILDETVRTAIKSLRQESQCEEDEEDDFESFVVACQEALPRYMRIGYRQVQRRFRADGFGVAALFDEIVNDKRIAAHYEPEERARLVIKIEPRSLRLDIDVQLYEDPYAHGT